MARITKDDVKRLKGKTVKPATLDTLRGLAEPYNDIDKFKDSVVFKQYCLKKQGPDALNNKEKFFMDDILEGIFRKEDNDKIIDDIELLITASTIKSEQETVDAEPVTVEVIDSEEDSEEFPLLDILSPEEIVFGKDALDGVRYIKGNAEKLRDILQKAMFIHENGGDYNEIADMLVQSASSLFELDMLGMIFSNLYDNTISEWLAELVYDSPTTENTAKDKDKSSDSQSQSFCESILARLKHVEHVVKTHGGCFD